MARRFWWLAAVAAALTGLVGCSGGAGSSSPSDASTSPTATTTSADTSGLPAGWVDDEVHYDAGGVTLHATYRHAASTAPAPAVLLIAGSGPTDRNGNQAGYQENSLRNLADALADDGVATLRYDKLYSGATGAGGVNPTTALVHLFEDEAEAGLSWLAAQPRTDPQKLSVFGHSEGGFYALLMAAAPPASAPPIHSLGLVESQSRRFLDIVAEQLRAQLEAGVTAGAITRANATRDEQQIDAAIAAIRAGGTPGPLPSYAQSLFNPSVLPYLRDIDRFDPADLARQLPAGLPVLLTCSVNDPQVTCGDVDHLAAGLRDARVDLHAVRLTGMDHALKADSSSYGAHNTDQLPLFPGLATAIAQFVGSTDG